MGSRRYFVILAALLLAGLAPGRSAGEEARPAADRVVATYDAGLAGMSLGTFKVIAKFDGSAYEMAADGRFSLLAGLLYSATGKTTSRGTLNGAAPQPAAFTLNYDGGKKREQRRMRFDHGAVSDVDIVPRKKKKNSRDIPVSAEQLKDVLDPLTAAFLSVRSDAPAGDLEVCDQTIPVFDGKQRFDLVLSPKRQERLGDSPNGVHGLAAVCRVRYKPISGHRPDHPGVQFMTKTDEIEAWLVPVPRTDLYVPYKILVPTGWGSGSVTLTGLKAKP
ncbi:hypothetical protein AUC69_01520 [Methyloceanibacter superfactus]|jgi:uncharacterized protein DUF3108|uniref:DUF3108 domain-containing protein n=1 Tax=Methyloceanibacter superfactus TaxID=1774969 RepID=A0A1E3VWA6_9HYPH|nr:DUF3108 domain-containing protein [Methyloceanibacter superfactus]ODR97817.1 hypothetical protein AUC69_01520 [Methyloceanibacter superfactus]